MAKKRYYSNDLYAGYEHRMSQEAQDSGMIKEDKSAIANLPQNVMIKDWPKTDYYRYDLDDTIKGIDVQINDDVRKERRKSNQKYPEKY